MRRTNAKELMTNWAPLCSHVLIFLTMSVITITTYAQNNQLPSLNIGDPAPPLQVREWIKGIPIQRFDNGHVYVVEFWATWCKPCIASMPHLSALARQYKDRATIMGVDIYENKTTPLEKVKAFVDSMGNRMDYTVVIEDSNNMVARWIEASGERDNGIPRTFVVNAEGRLAWIGHPKDLDDVLRNIVNDTWDINKAFAERNEGKRLRDLDKDAYYTLMAYVPDQFRPGYTGNPDSALLAIDEIVRKEPKLKYSPSIALYTFSSLLKTDLHKAYEYGKEVLVNPFYGDPDYGIIIGTIESVSEKVKLPVEIYALGAEAYQSKIDKYAEFGNMNIPKNYNNMAKMYFRANNKTKAVDAMQKAIETLKNEKGFSKKDIADFESRLQQYRNM